MTIQKRFLGDFALSSRGILEDLGLNKIGMYFRGLIRTIQ